MVFASKLLAHCNIRFVKSVGTMEWEETCNRKSKQDICHTLRMWVLWIMWYVMRFTLWIIYLRRVHFEKYILFTRFLLCSLYVPNTVLRDITYYMRLQPWVKHILKCIFRLWDSCCVVCMYGTYSPTIITARVSRVWALCTEYILRYTNSTVHIVYRLNLI